MVVKRLYRQGDGPFGKMLGDFWVGPCRDETSTEGERTVPPRIAIVDPRPDLLEFLKEQLEARGFPVVTAFTESELKNLEPRPDLALVDFERTVDLAEVMQAIEAGLRQEGKVGHRR